MMHDNDDNSETKIIIKKRITLNRQHEWAITTGMNPILIGGQTKITPHEYENYMLGCIQTYTLHRETVRHDRCYFSMRAYAWALYWMLCYAMLSCVVCRSNQPPKYCSMACCCNLQTKQCLKMMHSPFYWYIYSSIAFWCMLICAVKSHLRTFHLFYSDKRDSLAFSNTKSYTNAAQLQPVTSYNFQHKK